MHADIYTDFARTFVNTGPYTNFRGVLNANGLAVAKFNVSAGTKIPTGLTLYHAYVVYDGTTGQIFTSSNPVSVEFK